MKTSTQKNTSPPKKWQTLGKWYFKWTCCGPSSLKTLFLLMAPPKKEKKFTWNHHVIHLVDLWYLLLPKNPTKPDSQTPTLQAGRNRETFKWRNSIESISVISVFKAIASNTPRCYQVAWFRGVSMTSWHWIGKPPRIHKIKKRENLNWPHKKRWN